jgi:dipeptidyl aminopeptidase/acylaminoacyl peptidase
MPRKESSEVFRPTFTLFDLDRLGCKGSMQTTGVAFSRGITMKRLILASMALTLIATPVLTSESPPLIPLREFFRNPTETAHALSPSGDYLAFLKPWESRLNVHVRKIDDPEPTRVTSVTERDIAGFIWANDDRLVYVLDQGGDENFHLYGIGRDGTGLLDLTPFEETRAMLVDELLNDPDHILAQHNRRDKRVFDVFRVHVGTGEEKLVVENPGNITSFLADHEGRVRAAVTADGVNTSLLFRESEDEPFKTLLTVDFRQTLNPLFFTYDNRKLYCASNLGRDKAAIVVFDPATTNEVEVIFEHPQVDVSSLLRSDRRKIITGVAFTAARRAYHFLDQERAGIQRFLEAQLPGVEVTVAGHNRAEDRFLVRTFSDKTQGAWHYYDHRDRRLLHVADVSPWLPAEHLADVKPIVYQSRDGLLIHGYLTLPKGAAPRNLPTVILPHGGPWARDSWGFSPVLQFLANRGYAVLQMNFRGSTGYGRKFWEMSFKQWGKSMQDDVTDGVEWLIREGIADPKRIGIFGGSYGGYVVLAGLAFTPELYACGVDYVGVANLFTILETIPPYWEPMRDMLQEMMGHPEKEADLLRAVSPVFHADRIQAPLLIAQGARDPRVKKSESDQMVEALRKRGVEVPYMVKENEGHGFRNEENRLEVFRALEQFFGSHLGGAVGEGDDVLEALRAAPSGSAANAEPAQSTGKSP